MTLRLAFMGAPEFAAPSLTEIVAAGHEVACVYTQPPRPAGRGQAARRTPVHDLAESLGLPVRTPASLRTPEEQAAFAALGLDAAVVVAYGLILPPAILAAPRFGCLNLHPSPLPRWRGAAPIQRAIMAGDALTAVQIMRMDEGLDTGPILLSESAAIGAHDTAGVLTDRLARQGAQLWPRALAALERGVLMETPQADEGAAYAAKISKAEARIDWMRPAAEIDRLIRGLSPFPGAWFEMETPKGPVRVKALGARLEPELTGPPGEVLDAALAVGTGAGAVRLTRLQREGRPALDAEAFLRGAPVPPGTHLR
jgi:methionyl-tRNA formyltransferase